MYNIQEFIMTETNKKMRSPEAASYLQMAPSTLAKLRCTNGGPRFSKMGPRLVVYDRADLDAWLANRLCHSTSDYGSLARRNG
jgi:predicted DNA-binding transcriptional regulator AlpA